MLRVRRACSFSVPGGARPFTSHGPVVHVHISRGERRGARTTHHTKGTPMDSERIQSCLDLIHQARQLPVDDAQRRLLEQAAGELVRDGRLRRRAEARAERAAADAKLLAATAMGARDRVMDAALLAPAPPERGSTVREYVQLRPGPPRRGRCRTVRRTAPGRHGC